MDLHDRRVNAGIGLAALACVAAAGLVGGDPLWTGFAAVAVALAAVPAVRVRDRFALPPWELLALAALPAAVHAAFADAPDFLLSATTYLGVAALALLFAAQLHAFGEPELSPAFSVAFVTAGTMAAAGVWTVARFASDVALDTTLLPPEDPLMTELVVATAVGVAAGVVFQFYLVDVVDGLDALATGAAGGSGETGEAGETA